MIKRESHAESGDESIVSKMGIRCLKRKGRSGIWPHFSGFSFLHLILTKQSSYSANAFPSKVL